MLGARIEPDQRSTVGLLQQLHPQVLDKGHIDVEVCRHRQASPLTSKGRIQIPTARPPHASDGCHAAIDRDDLAGDKSGGVGSEQYRDTFQILVAAQTLERRQIQNHLL